MIAALLWLVAAALAAPPAEAEIRLSTKGDDISFDKNVVEVTRGRKLDISFVNGASAGSEISHNVVVLMPGADIEAALFRHLYEVSFDLTKVAGDPGILAFGKPLAPGQTETLSLVFPGPGTYPYLCLMPGHGDMMGMRGTIVVR